MKISRRDRLGGVWYNSFDKIAPKPYFAVVTLERIGLWA